MKNTAHLPALLFASLAVTAFAAETTPAPVTPEPAAAPTVTATALPSAPTETATVAALPQAPAATPAPDANLTPLANPQPADNKLADPNVVELPKMTVKQKPRPRLTPEVMVTKKAYGEDLAKQKFTQLDQALNKYTLPLFGSSMAERALDEREREKREQLNMDVLNIVKTLETTDPAEAESLKKAARP